MCVMTHRSMQTHCLSQGIHTHVHTHKQADVGFCKNPVRDFIFKEQSGRIGLFLAQVWIYYMSEVETEHTQCVCVCVFFEVCEDQNRFLTKDISLK